MFESHMTKEQQLRKYQNDMVIIGGGIIAFALWGVMRYLLVLFFLDTETFTELDKLAKADPKNASLYYSMILTMIAIQLALIIVIRLFIGLGARSEGLGKKKRYLYILATFILIVISAYSIPLLIQTFGEDGQDVFSVVVEILIDLTSIVMMIELLVAIYKSRRLKKELEQEAL